jgi:hypothetical protein
VLVREERGLGHRLSPQDLVAGARARPRVDWQSLPRDAAERELRAESLRQPGDAQGTDDVAAAADSKDERLAGRPKDGLQRFRGAQDLA